MRIHQRLSMPARIEVTEEVDIQTLRKYHHLYATDHLDQNLKATAVKSSVITLASTAISYVLRLGQYYTRVVAYDELLWSYRQCNGVTFFP